MPVWCPQNLLLRAPKRYSLVSIPAEFTPKWDSKKKKWRVSIPEKYSPTGKRRREYFKNEQDALNRAEELKSKTKLSQRVAHAAGPELIRAAVNYDELFRDIYGFENGLEQACEYLMKRLDEESRATRFGELVDAYEKEHFDGWSKNYRTKWSWFVNAVEDLKDSIVLPMDGTFWSNWMRQKAEEKDWSDGTYNDLLSLLRSVWKHGVGLSLADRNPMEGLRRKKIRRTEKAIYTVDQTRKLLDCAWKHDREMVPFFAIALFAGLRPDVGSEICSLTWDDVNFKERWIRVGASFDNKTATKRFVPLENNLSKWLEPWTKAQGPVTPRNLTNRRRWIVRGKYQAGENVTEDDWSELVPSGMEYRDVTRHTYGSYLEAKYKDRNIVKENMGHSSFTTYEQHYRNARSPEEAKRFWDIVPSDERAT